jgi:hypothetical protein
MEASTKATQERMDANLKDLKEDIKFGQAEVRSIVRAFHEKMDACVANRRDDQEETMSCQETMETSLVCEEPISWDMKACQEKTACHKATERETENTQPDPGMMQSIAEHQEVPKEDAAVMLVGGLRKRCRDWMEFSCQKLKERIQASYESSRRLTVAGRKLSRHAAVAQCKRKVFQKNSDRGKLWTMQGVGRCRNKDEPLCKSGMRQGTQAAQKSKRRHCT